LAETDCSNQELEGTLHPKNLDVPPKMKVKGYMYPQMKKPVGILTIIYFLISVNIIGLLHEYLYNNVVLFR
jgi:hypothetical protein